MYKAILDFDKDTLIVVFGLFSGFILIVDRMKHIEYLQPHPLKISHRLKLSLSCWIHMVTAPASIIFRFDSDLTCT